MKSIKVGTQTVKMALRNDENIQKMYNPTSWYAEIKVAGHWILLGTYDTEEAAYKHVYLEREDYSAAYGA